MGVNSTRVIQLTFLLGGIMAGAAAFLYMIKIETTRFDVGFLLGVKAFTAAVFPVRAQRIRGVSPDPTMGAFDFAPAFRSFSTIAAFPLSHASQRGVTP